MLIHPWDEATREEWQGVLAGADFGQLVTAGHVDGFPVVVPTHFLYDGDSTVLLHLARPNPAWKALEADPHVVLALTGDYTYVEAAWNANPAPTRRTACPRRTTPPSSCSAAPRSSTIPDEKAAILAAQLGHFEPADSSRVTPSPANESDRRQLPGIRGLRLHIEAIRAKMKYGGNKAAEHRREIAGHLADRDGPMDAAARDHLLRRLDEREDG